MDRSSVLRVFCTLGLLALFDVAAARPPVAISAEDRAFLLAELERIDPPDRIRDLAEYGERQLELGGGFYGMMPAQLADFDTLTPPRTDLERLEVARRLARQRQENLRALRELNPDYAITFGGESLAVALDRLGVDEPDAGHSHALELDFDVSALAGYFDALDDGRVSRSEARDLARLAPNQEMLRHRRSLGYVPEPLPDTESLATMIRWSGSIDPLDRLWCWVNPQNAFGYADLFVHREAYEDFLLELDRHGPRMVDAALARIAGFVPTGTRFSGRFALTVGWAIRGWATPAMVGVNVEQVKDDWDLLLGTLTEEIFHRIQLQIVPTPVGGRATEFSDLVVADTGDAGLDAFHELIAYTVLEGSATLVRQAFGAVDLAADAEAGFGLVERFVERVVDGGDHDAADAMIDEGLRGNGPLYACGLALARAVAAAEGPRAVGRWLAAGPAQFLLRAVEAMEASGRSPWSDDVMEAARRVREALAAER